MSTNEPPLSLRDPRGRSCTVAMTTWATVAALLTMLARKAGQR